MNFASNANYLYLSGTLTIDGGSCSVGSATGTQGIRTSKTGTNVPLLNISSGSMTLNGGITYRTSFSADPFYFKMTGGTLSIECGTTGSANEALKITDVAGSVFEMSGGTIIFQKPNATGGALIDVDICGTNGAVYTTGGTMLFGNASTPASSIFNFKPYANAVYPHMEVANSNSTLKPSPGSGNTAHYRFLSLKIDAGAAFDNRSFSGTQGDSKDMYLVEIPAVLLFRTTALLLKEPVRLFLPTILFSILEVLRRRHFTILKCQMPRELFSNHQLLFQTFLL
ncbi:MAG: hypothetical protein IPP51_11725 [Bacteroidetes bacterium]|nr:hypothetical protein [Bacteroidota bacterium]